MQRRMNPAPQEPSAQAAGHGGRHVRSHHHIEPLHGQMFCQISRQAGGQGRNEKPLNKPQDNQVGHLLDYGASQTTKHHDQSTSCDDGLDG